VSHLPRSRALLATAACAIALLGEAAALAQTAGGATAQDRPALTGAPKRIVLGARRWLKLTLARLPGEGEPQLTLNVGKLRRVKELPDGRLSFRIRLPRKRSPQELMLLARRPSGPIYVYRLPLLGRTRVRIRAKPRSTITFRYANQQLDKPMGRRRARRFRLVVPPGVDKVRVEVVAPDGTKNERDVKVKRPSYQRLLLGAAPVTNSSARPRFEIAAALAEGKKREERPTLEVRAPAGQWRTLPARIEGDGTLRATLLPRTRGEHRLRLTFAGQSQELALQAAHAVPLPVSRPAVVTTRPTSRPTSREVPTPEASRWALDVSLAAGLLYNTGELLSPAFALGVGVSYSLGSAGALGLRFGAALAWDSQTIAGPPGFDDAESSIFVIPLTLGPFYRGPASWPVVPYGGVAFALQLVVASSEASFTEERISTEVSPGVLGFAGAELPLGLVAPFLEAGFLYSRVESADVELLAGGLLVLAGARLYL
jgi:hypothetical protein